MQITIETRPPAAIETEALVSYVFEQDNPIEGAVAELDRIAGGALRKLAASGEITGKSLEMTLLHSVSGLVAERLLLVGAGKPEKFDAAELRRLAGAALRH
ncbi:MAG: M17 family peptidase N-terminal domain-containing protein, partial [Candidatus Acidiferrales bacterium]